MKFRGDGRVSIGSTASNGSVVSCPSFTTVRNKPQRGQSAGYILATRGNILYTPNT
jgi:hypothetical protein